MVKGRSCEDVHLDLVVREENRASVRIVSMARL